MYCPYCGKEISDTSKFCTECGASIADTSEKPAADPEFVEAEVVSEPSPIYTETTYSSNSAPYNRDSNSGLFLAAFVLNIVSTVSLAPFIIPLAWAIPMTVYSYKIYKGNKPNTVAFGVCTLIFLNLVAGILMLVAEKEE